MTKEVEKDYLDLVEQGALNSWNNIIEITGNDKAKEAYGTIDNFMIERLKINKEELNTLRDKFRIPYERFKSIKKRATNQKGNVDLSFFGGLSDFAQWYEEQEQKCHYCGTTAEELEKIFSDKSIKSKKKSFNATLQIDKKNSDRGYKKENCVLACCLCNNAKSDMISSEDYKKYFAEPMRNFLKNKFKK